MFQPFINTKPSVLTASWPQQPFQQLVPTRHTVTLLPFSQDGMVPGFNNAQALSNNDVDHGIHQFTSQVSRILITLPQTYLSRFLLRDSWYVVS